MTPLEVGARVKQVIIDMIRVGIPDEAIRRNFWSELYRSGGVIAGSAVVYALLPEEKRKSWTPNDIDVWIPMENKCNMFSCYLVESGYDQRNVIPNKTYARLTKYVQRIVVYAKPKGPKIQIIVTKLPKDKMTELIISFDIVATQFLLSVTSLNTSTFNVDIYDVSKQQKASHDLNSHLITISEKALTMQKNIYEWVRTLERICKYYIRGFEISHAEVNEIVKRINSIETVDNESIYHKIEQYFNFIGYCLEYKNNKFEKPATDCPYKDINPTTPCLNYITLTSNTIDEISQSNRRFRNKNNLNKLVLVLLTEGDKNYHGTQFRFADFQKLSNDPSNVFFPCVNGTYDITQPYIKISLCTGQYFVSKHHYTICIDTITNEMFSKGFVWTFGLSETNTIIQFSASMNAVNAWRGQGSIVSAAHCQDGTSFKVYNLFHTKYNEFATQPKPIVLEVPRQIQLQNDMRRMLSGIRMNLQQANDTYNNIWLSDNLANYLLKKIKIYTIGHHAHFHTFLNATRQPIFIGNNEIYISTKENDISSDERQYFENGNVKGPPSRFNLSHTYLKYRQSLQLETFKPLHWNIVSWCKKDIDQFAWFSNKLILSAAALSNDRQIVVKHVREQSVKKKVSEEYSVYFHKDESSKLISKENKYINGLSALDDDDERVPPRFSAMNFYFSAWR